MATDSYAVEVAPGSSHGIEIIIAAVRLHDALFYAGREVIDSLPEHARRAWSDLQRAVTIPPNSRP